MPVTSSELWLVAVLLALGSLFAAWRDGATRESSPQLALVLILVSVFVGVAGWLIAPL